MDVVRRRKTSHSSILTHKTWCIHEHNVKNFDGSGDGSTYKLRRAKRLPINSTEFFPQIKVTNILMVKIIYFLLLVICLGVRKAYVLDHNSNQH